MKNTKNVVMHWVSFYESVLKPDPELRQCAHNQKCFNELMEWREEIIRYLDERRIQEFHS